MEPLRTAYCTNVAPAGSVDALVDGLSGLWCAVRERAGLERLGLGLWLRDQVAAELAGDAAACERVRDTLAANGLDLVTVNAFPARAFHAQVVKEAVYRPSWLEEERAAYTLDVARAVAAIAGPRADVTLSTLPVAFPKRAETEMAEAAERLVRVAGELARIASEGGPTLRLALEPEPCCALETTAETLAFFERHLRRAGWEAAAEHLGVCLDLCHACVEHEDPIEALHAYAAAGVPVFKVQVSAALEVPDPSDPLQRERLAAFAEERWLHQVGAAAGRVVADLPEALGDSALARARPWRVHFHVPLHRDEVGGLPTTRPEVERFLDHVAGLAEPPVLELETYTWSVVPGASEDLAGNVAAEVRWVLARLEAR